MNCIAIGEYNKQVKDIMEAMGAYQLNFDEAADRLGITPTPKLREIYDERLTRAFRDLTPDGATIDEQRIFESMLASTPA